MITQLLYLRDFTLVTGTAHVVEITEFDGMSALVLDQTVFYPQGGGQPCDVGVIKGQQGIFEVQKVRKIDDKVLHAGIFTSGSIAVGESVTCLVDVGRRQLHNRLHSAGHVVDMAVKELGLSWIPGKGYHFPDGPYVEYEGILPQDKEQLQKQLEQRCNDILARNEKTKLVLQERSGDHPLRFVYLGDTFGIACGGTHVSALADIPSIQLRKIKASGNTVKVSYSVS